MFKLVSKGKLSSIPEDLVFPPEYEKYFSEILEKLEEIYEIAALARAKGFDPVPFPEVKIASDLASRVEAMVGPKGIAARIRELLRNKKEIEEIAFIVAEEIAEGKYGIDDLEERANQAIKTATAVLVGGITAAPLEGITHVKIRDDGHLAVYYAGPIRSAGGTETALTVIIADVVRRALKLPPYRASKVEIERFVEEVVLYNRYASLQYPVDVDKITLVLKNLPVEITGEGTLDAEVSGPYRNIPHIETNKIRGGAVLVLNDGLIAKAKKVLKIIRRIGVEGWDWLEQIVSGEKEANGEEHEGHEHVISPDYTYLSDVIAGRPVFASPSYVGGFRLRYGRSRNTGLAAVGIHPATMYILREFLAVGTQIKTERPGKGAVVMPVDSIMPPLVRLKDGTVMFVHDVETAKRIIDDVDKILFLGDILVAVGEFLENNHIILPSPIVEEWWVQELLAVINKRNDEELRFEDVVEKASNDPIFAITLSEQLGIPLHPRWTYFWRNITDHELIKLRNVMLSVSSNNIPQNPEIKEILEKLYIPHKILQGKIVLDEGDYKALRYILSKLPEDYSPRNINGLEALRISTSLDIKDKYPVFIGVRMGRPEKAKQRMMKPPVHVLFPIGSAGHRSRSIIRIANNRIKSEVEAVNKYCPRCGIHTYENTCPICGRRTVLKYRCPKCGNEFDSKGTCPRCKVTLVPYRKYKIDFVKLLQEKVKKLGVKMPKDVKGVIGLTSSAKMPEPFEKGILRGRYGLYVFKDGTIRFDATDAPLTHFKPREVGVSISKLKELGYERDIYGKPLENEDQILELKVQDIIINEECAEYLVRAAQFIDELLEKFYGLKPYYKVTNKYDLIGHLVVGLAPHTSAGIIGRIIGFTKAQCIFAHPYWHAAKRRNCDGDEDAVMLLLDVLINFSRDYLPKTRGGMMDAPLVITSILNPFEVDSEVYNMDTMFEIPREFYIKSLEYPKPEKIEEIIENVEKRLGKPEQYNKFGYSHETTCIDLGPHETSYKRLKSMKDKIDAQFKLMSQIIAVNLREVSDKILEVHFFPDIMGNLRAYGSQQFRCISCNTKLRRPPLNGKCPRCGGNIVQTIYRKTVLKYSPIAKKIIESYGASEYNIQRFRIFELTDFYIMLGAKESEKLTELLNKMELAEKSEYELTKSVKGKNVVSLEDFLK